MLQNDPYLIPGTQTLRNKLGITDPLELDEAERILVANRMAGGIPRGQLDLDHLRHIHLHLFQDVYDWAGELRKVELAREDQRFLPGGRIYVAMSDVGYRLASANYLSVRPEMKLGDINDL